MQRMFAFHLWMLLNFAHSLESLCLIGWNTKRTSGSRIEPWDFNTPADEWQMRSLPYPLPSHASNINSLKYLRFLELKRVDIDPSAFVRMIDDNSQSLKELHLNQVHLKVCGPSGVNNNCRWIGHAPEETKPDEAIWIAEYLREKKSLKLDIVRATNLGYDTEPAINVGGSPVEKFDLHDPSEKSFDQRFVNAVMGVVTTLPSTPSTGQTNPAEDSWQMTFSSLPKHLYEVEAYQRTPFPYDEYLDSTPFRKTPHKTSYTRVQEERHSSCQVLARTQFLRDNNTTSHFKRSIDGVFYNHNERALVELHKIIGVVAKAMNVMNEQVERITRDAEAST